jgi:hypothetical protein
MTTSISNVKIIFKSIKSKKCINVRTDEKGYFKFTVEEPEAEYKVIIKKKKYIPINIESFSLKENFKYFYFKVILKRMLSVHDKNYDGFSKVLSIEKK